MNDLLMNNLLNKTNIHKIYYKTMTVNTIQLTKLDLFKTITNLLLDKCNLFFYVTQRQSANTLENTKKYVQDLYNNGLIEKNVKSLFKCIGWDKDNLNINDTTFQGDLGEYLMNILIDNFNISKTLISKVSLKTSPKVPSFGNDNIYFDYDKNILFFGESKFYSDTNTALSKLKNSILLHNKEDIEISFIINKTQEFIAEDNTSREKIIQKIETVDTKDLHINYIGFIMSEDAFSNIEYENIITKFIDNNDIDETKLNEIILIFLPIISKKEFLEYFKESLS